MRPRLEAPLLLLTFAAVLLVAVLTASGNRGGGRVDPAIQRAAKTAAYLAAHPTELRRRP
jgi:hypothetical protein